MDSHQTHPLHTGAEGRIAAAWRDDRAYVLAIASRILADPTEAEDVVQDAFARLAVQQVDEIHDLRGWLVVVVRRLALDRLGGAYRRLTRPSDPHDLPAASVPLAGAAEPGDPADRITLDDEVRRALGVVLDQLSPPERVAFVLHDVFAIPFDTIGEIVGRSPAACRQAASRARRSVRDAAPTTRDRGPDAELRELVERFIAACDGEDLDALARTLHPEVEGWATLDGATLGFASGIDEVAARAMALFGRRSGWSLAPLPITDGMAMLVTRDGEPLAVARVEARDGLLHRIHSLLLPASVEAFADRQGEHPAG